MTRAPSLPGAGARPTRAADSRLIRRAALVGATATVVAFVVLAALWGSGSAPVGPAGCGRVWEANPATATPIKHLFVIVKENHAFENYFGALPGAVGYPPNGSFSLAFNSSAVVHPFPLAGYSTADFPHDEAAELVDYDGGLNDLFVAEANARGVPNPADAVGYYTAKQIPAYYEYARSYALGDEFFTGVLGPTNPNRVFDLSAYAGNWDADTPPPANVTNRTTILDQLTDNNLPWEYDYNGYPYWLAPLSFPTLTNDPCSSTRITPDSGLPSQLASSTPPAVVYLDPSNSLTYSEHPPENVSIGEQWTVAVINTILESPVANSSAILVFFDEAGGYWDPVPPPLTSTGRDGFRVPLLVISPWTPRGRICSTVVDSASVLNFIDTNWRLPVLSPRVVSATNLSCFFDFAQPPRPPEILPTNVSLANEREALNPGGHPTEFSGPGVWLLLPGGGGQLTVVRAGNGRPLRKVPTPGNTGSSGSPTGESPSSGAETAQPDGTVKVVHWRLHRDMVKRPTPREQALTDGRRSFPDRRGERAVECCLEQNGAYYHDLAGTSVK